MIYLFIFSAIVCIVLGVLVFRQIKTYDSMLQGIADYIDDLPESTDLDKD